MAAAVTTAAAAATSTAGASLRTAADALVRGPLIAKSGEHIFVYTHIRTKQTIYSLTRSMQRAALKQLTYVGKKTVPAGLRKDMWQPLCVLSFPHAEQGLDAYRKLREFRKLHETAYERATVQRTTGPGAGRDNVPKREKMAILQDQKANSVADMAHVLFMQSRAPSADEVSRAKWWHQLPKVQTKRGTVTAPDRPKYGRGSKPTMGDVAWRGSVKGVKINWNDMLDAEFAATWPDDVLHGSLERNRFTAVWPPVSEASRTAGEQQQEHGEAGVGTTQTA